MNVSSQHDPAQIFRRLERSVLLIVRHPNFPGKADAIRRCREDIEQRYHQGLLTNEQKTHLLAILGEEE